MKPLRTDNTIVIGTSKLKFLRNITAFLQFVFHRAGLQKKIYLSDQYRGWNKMLIEDVNRLYKIALIEDLGLGRLAEKILITKVVDIRRSANFKSFSREDLYLAMWTLVFCDCATEKSKKNIKEIITPDFPIYFEA